MARFTGSGGAAYVNERMNWETPPELYAKLDAEFHFTLDVCATANNAKATRFYSPEDDGLTQQWSGVCWMNPPYGREIGKWMRKALHESQCGSVVVCLVPARTDTKWWHETAIFAHEIRLIRGRVRFLGGKHSAPFPSAVVVFRPRSRGGRMLPPTLLSLGGPKVWVQQAECDSGKKGAE